MTSTTSCASARLPASAPAAARSVFRLLPGLRHGTLDMQLPDGGTARFGTARDGQLRAALRLRNWQPCAAALRSGDIGFAESYIAGDWTTPDLAVLLKLLMANRDDIESVVYGTWWGSLLHRARHLLHRNSARGSERNVQAHYDLGNAFYGLWLDETMNYSSAWFEGDFSRPLEDAQRAKLRRTLDQCGVGAGDRVLEIGCGWGALAEMAARDRGAHVTGVTLSHEQLAYADARLARQGFAKHADLALRDYRSLRDEASPPYDAIVSIEMFEAVGREYWPAYFETIAKRLKAGGSACIQTIVIRDDLFARYLRSTDFIQQYIFPGGMLPSASAFRAAAAAAGLKVTEEFAFGRDYAETLRRWRALFLGAEGPVRQLGFDTRFLRIWEFYLAYCEAAFETGNTNVVQFTLRHA